MYQPHNIFAFESGLTLHIFVATGDFDVTEFDEFADRASEECIPEKVAVYYPKDLIKKDDLNRAEKKIKARFHCDPVLYSFNEKGYFGTNESAVESYLKKGANEIIRLRKPVVLPPPGRSFVKPSGTRESYFIHAANLFIRHAEMSFYALLLIRKWGDLFDEKIKTVYVDTIDLYGLVSVACRMRFGTGAHGPITVSYSSYSSYTEVLWHADVSKSLMVISATTSHNLMKKIHKDTKWKSVDRIVTILDLNPELRKEDENDSDRKVISYVTPKGLQPHTKLLPSIRLSGEKFTIEADEPKAVVLNTVAHAKCLKVLKLDKLKDMASCLGGYAKNGIERLPISVDAVELFKSPIFLKWLENELKKYAPASTSHVVCIGDFADRIRPFLKMFGERELTFISPEDLRDSTVTITGSTVVICPTFTTGTKLLEVSRDLRRHIKHQKNKNIVYFTGVGTPVSLSEFKKLKSNLEHQVYQVRNFCNVCTGEPTSLNLSWKSEQELLRVELAEVEALDDRRNALENGNLRDDELFYRVEDLDFHLGFKYWDKLVDYEAGDKPSVLLFATFSFLLQNGRTDESLPEKNKLEPLPNRRVVLDPENFFRYNDSLIQIAILRAAFPGELDFSDHEAHSASIFYLIQRAEQVSQRSVVYEFLLALVSQRLSITHDELGKVCTLIEKSSLQECSWFRDVEFFKNFEK